MGHGVLLVPRDAMHKRGLCCHAVSVCPSVTFVHHIKTNKHIFEIFSPLVSNTILFFPYQRGCRYSDGNPLIFGLTHWLKYRITRKLLNIDRYMLRDVWQPLNCLSIHATYCMIVAGASPGETKMRAVVRENGNFFTFVDHVKTNKHMFEFISPSGSHTILVYRSYTDTKHRTASLRQQTLFD